ncbi:hypothetical protein Poli38472_000795 [Pythium oligandrum]|uniref:Uncharacterized protein n=1 Tax=Pythium oligandrum TaxID=41045 RepID=A0A8K1CD08_PYTOL|nr:hypothetical protein Poli38472_000795 [Pythium oligandrum]|eukprot:TMW60753.1 hypothetical protein Poli38472_000795 [Pythium oligandrum]
MPSREISANEKSIEEQLHLQRIFRHLAFDFPLERLESKLQKLSEKLCNKHMTGNHDGFDGTRNSKIHSENEVEHAKYLRERSKYIATVQEEANNGKELVATKHQIDATALLYAYEKLGCTLPHGRAQAEEMIWEINDNLDGMISYDEFERSYLRARSDRTGLEPSELFFLICFLMFDKECAGQITLDDAMKIFYLKYDASMEEEMEIHFGHHLDHGVHVISFTEYRDAILKRSMQLIDQQAAVAKTGKHMKRV